MIRLCKAVLLVLSLGGCAPRQAPRPPVAPLFDNLGHYHHPISTDSVEAQRYFDQGLRLIYGFNHEEAIRAFESALAYDPKCAMCYWGIGFAHGPNYNLPLDSERNQKAYAATHKAVELKDHANHCEQQYIEALARRYTLAAEPDRKQLDRDFADSMRQVAKRCPEDLDAATLFAESMMDLRPWDLWTTTGKPQPGTEEITATLEAVMKRDPNHPGANHYYIHSVEASPHPERALPSAERLKDMVPGAGHLVHMPSHIYMRTGHYAEAAEANRLAIAADRQYLEVAKPAGVYPMMYYPHNIHFLWAAASMEGRRQEALQAARDLVSQLDAAMVRQMPMLEMYTPTLIFAYARFGMWDELLAEPSPPDDLAYTRAMWHYGRALAFIARGKIADAQSEEREMKDLAKQVPADRIIGDNTPAAVCLRVASETVAGEMLLRRRQSSAGFRHLQMAVKAQDSLPYSEPPPWYYPVRETLGAALLAAGDAKRAEQVYRDDLRRNPENGRSLFGLAQALRRQGREREAQKVEARFKKAWKNADIQLVQTSR